MRRVELFGATLPWRNAKGSSIIIRIRYSLRRKGSFSTPPLSRQALSAGTMGISIFFHIRSDWKKRPMRSREKSMTLSLFSLHLSIPQNRVWLALSKNLGRSQKCPNCKKKLSAIDWGDFKTPGSALRSCGVERYGSGPRIGFPLNSPILKSTLIKMRLTQFQTSQPQQDSLPNEESWGDEFASSSLPMSLECLDS